MNTATNITPIEQWEEGTYNTLIIVCISGFIGSLLLISHLFVFHGILSYFYITVGLSFLAGSILFPILKARRFGERNLSLGERVWKLEMALGENVA